jgi:hypothetical protein
LDPSRAHKLFAIGLAALLLGLELVAIAGPHEDWPFTAAPMFARYHAREQPLFEIDVFVRDSSGARRPLRARELGLGELSFKRQLFARWYGSTDPRHPAGHHANDTPQRFAARMAEFLDRLAKIETRRTRRAPAVLELEVRRVAPPESRVVGRYNVSERRFERGVAP